MDLSPRLAAIAAQVPPGSHLADVGTDHAYLPVALLLEGRIPSAVASDVNQGPLERGRETALQAGVEGRIDFRLADGLDGLEGSDVVVIAGMGGELIARILSRAPWTRQALLLLQPMTAQPELRLWLTENDYRIERETLVREGNRLYLILAVRGGQSPHYSRGELWAGRQREGEKSPLRLAYLDDLLRRRRRALAGMEQSAHPPEGLAQERQLLKELEDLRKEWIKWHG